jgi:putative NIF3 family GTP cyclohydrolase 1 type 2
LPATARILVAGRVAPGADRNGDNAVVRLSEIMAMANSLAGCAQTPPDSQIYLDGEVRRVFVGIDVDVGELLLARQLGADGVIAHHPIGSKARLGMAAVIERHEQQLRTAGVADDVAHELMLARKQPVAHAVHSTNYDRVVDAIRQLAIPAMNVHLAADIVGRRFFIDFVNRAVGENGGTVGALIGELKMIPEMEASLVQPELWLGRPENAVGRWFVQMAAGTNGGAAIYRTYYEHGVDTILAMHIDDAELRKLQQDQRETANLVITGHMPSDSIGINRLIRAMEDRGLEVIAGSGVIRV